MCNIVPSKFEGTLSETDKSQESELKKRDTVWNN